MSVSPDEATTASSNAGMSLFSAQLYALKNQSWPCCGDLSVMRYAFLWFTCLRCVRFDRHGPNSG
eukprot:3809230-Lingulodinium_polyedra.AAC.1